VPAAGKDEIARLGSVFNDMIVRVQGLYASYKEGRPTSLRLKKLSHTGSLGWNVSSAEIYWSEETYKIFEYDRALSPLWS